MIRAKFICESNEKSNEEEHNIIFRTVVGGSEENDLFFKATPAGEITISVVKKEVAERFIVGRNYFVDFTIVKEEE